MYIRYVIANRSIDEATTTTVLYAAMPYTGKTRIYCQHQLGVAFLLG